MPNPAVPLVQPQISPVRRPAATAIAFATLLIAIAIMIVTHARITSPAVKKSKSAIQFSPDSDSALAVFVLVVASHSNAAVQTVRFPTVSAVGTLLYLYCIDYVYSLHEFFSTDYVASACRALRSA